MRVSPLNDTPFAKVVRARHDPARRPEIARCNLQCGAQTGLPSPPSPRPSSDQFELRCAPLRLERGYRPSSSWRALRTAVLRRVIKNIQVPRGRTCSDLFSMKPEGEHVACAVVVVGCQQALAWSSHELALPDVRGRCAWLEPLLSCSVRLRCCGLDTPA